jgi:hypothetical protein
LSGLIMVHMNHGFIVLGWWLVERHGMKNWQDTQGGQL